MNDEPRKVDPDRFSSRLGLPHLVPRETRVFVPALIEEGDAAIRWRARTCRGSTRAAIGSMLFRSPGRQRPTRYARNGSRRSPGPGTAGPRPPEGPEPALG